VISDVISVKLDINIHHVSVIAEKLLMVLSSLSGALIVRLKQKRITKLN